MGRGSDIFRPMMTNVAPIVSALCTVTLVLSLAKAFGLADGLPWIAALAPMSVIFAVNFTMSAAVIVASMLGYRVDATFSIGR